MTVPPDRPLVEARLDSIREALGALEALRSITLEEYRADVVRRSSVERLICRLVETAGQINAHLSARLLGSAPADYHDSFLRAAETGALDGSFAAEIARSAGLRNRIVHEYEKVDHAVAHAAIPLALEQFRRYLSEILDFLGGAGRAPS
ncbi:MAG: DUF86 domain-containing protein [Acidobacteria bacterium]|nr:DUF86 domain-containing protein [Acidobacteriota bacterium]